MYRPFLLIQSSVMCVAITAASLGQTTESTRSTQQPAQPTARAIQPSTILEDAFVTFFQNEPSGYFHDARWACVNHHPSLAATNLRKAAAQFRLEAHRSTTDDCRQSLQRCAIELEKLASNLNPNMDMQPTTAAMDHAFTRAHRTMAQHRINLAKERRTRNMHVHAAANLLSASENAEAGFAWGNLEMTAPEMDAAANTAMLAPRIESGETISDAEFTRILTNIENQVKRLTEDSRSGHEDSRSGQEVSRSGQNDSRSGQTVSLSGQWEQEPTDVIAQPERIEALWIVYADEPTTQFYAARHAILTRQFPTAASALERAEAFIILQAEHATGKVKADLTASAQDIADITYDIEQDVKVSVYRTDHVFAKAEIAMAEYFRHKAKESHAKKDAIATGHSLRAAATHFERGAAWTGNKLDSGVANTVYGTRFLAGKIMAGAGWTADEVGKGIDALGRGIDEAGKWVASPNTTDTEPKR